MDRRRSRPATWLPARLRAGAPFGGLLDRRRVGPATWFPARLRAGARLSLEESRRKEHQGGERLSPPWTHLSLVFARREVVFFYPAWPAAHLSHARDSPPTGWAGWERQEFWDPLRWAPKIGECTPNRASKAGTLGVRSVFCPAHVRAKKQIAFHSGPCEGRKSATLLSHPNPTPAKCESKSGHVHGHRNSHSTETMRHIPQNQRAAASGP